MILTANFFLLIICISTFFNKPVYTCKKTKIWF